MNATLTLNPALNGLELSFTGKPAADVLDALKTHGFRWHRQKRLWYAKDTAERRALCDTLTGGKAPENALETPCKATTKKTGTKQTHILFYYNGIKVDGKLIRCGYSMSTSDNSITIFAKGYGDDLPRDVLPVENDTDVYTDYFDTDGATIGPEHPLYKFARYAGLKAQARLDKPYCEKLRERLNSGKREPWPGHYDNLRHDLERREKFLSDFEKEIDPGQPTAEDLAEIDRQRQEEENARRQAEHEAELLERERVLNMRATGRQYIQKVAEEYPIRDGAPVVEIPFSESPYFYSYTDSRDQTYTVINQDGTTETIITKPRERCILSLKAADVVLAHFDAERHAEGRGYNKTDFIITYGDPDSEDGIRYEGRYDLGDNEGGLINHIRNFGEYYRTHDQYGHELETPPETTPTLEALKRLEATL